MNPASDSRSGGREAPRASPETDTKNKQTTPNAPPKNVPSTDMQGEDAGTAASGTDSRGTAAESAMKQEHKTGQERKDGR